MVFQISPGVNVSEIDLTTIVPAVGTTEGVFAGEFAWGPVEEIVGIANEVELVNRFGKPDSNTFTDFFTCANFLSYARDLKVVRASANTTLLNAVANGSAVLIKNQETYEETYSSGANTYGAWAAKYPGELGNSLKVSMYASSNTAGFDAWPYNGYFDSAPNTSTYVTNQLGSKDEMHVIVIDEDGKFSGIANTVLERFSFVSAASDAKNDDGTTNYYKEVVNSQSQYINWMAHPDIGIGWGNTGSWGTAAAGVTFGEGGSGATANIPYTISLSAGTTEAPSNNEIVTGFLKFANPEETDVSLIMTGDTNNTVVGSIISNIAEVRKDCVVFVSPEKTDVVNNKGSEATDINTYRDALTSTSYAFMDSGWKYQFDRYNNVNRWVPLNGDIAGLCVRTDYERDAWFSPAGFNRGQIKNVIKLAWTPNNTERDTLYKKGVNPVTNFRGQGTILYGDKTMLARPSAFDRIGVRRLFIVLEKAISRASKFSLFEFNDAFTRAQFVSLVDPYLRDVQGRRGIFDYRVICDETNNTPVVIDRNEFVGDIYIKPARSINYIQLNFVAVGTAVSFDEVIGRF
jgi:hypothetical protein